MSLKGWLTINRKAHLMENFLFSLILMTQPNWPVEDFTIETLQRDLTYVECMTTLEKDYLPGLNERIAENGDMVGFIDNNGSEVYLCLPQPNPKAGV